MGGKTCTACGKVFPADDANFARHNLDHQRRFHCPNDWCTKSFARKTHLEHHLNITKKKKTTPCSREKQERQEQARQCQHCGKRFASAVTLKRHVRKSCPVATAPNANANQNPPNATSAVQTPTVLSGPVPTGTLKNKSKSIVEPRPPSSRITRANDKPNSPPAIQPAERDGSLDPVLKGSRQRKPAAVEPRPQSTRISRSKDKNFVKNK